MIVNIERPFPEVYFSVTSFQVYSIVEKKKPREPGLFHRDYLENMQEKLSKREISPARPTVM